MQPNDAQDEIKRAIAFYEARGWEWLSVVAYLSACAVGTWPPPKRETKRGGRPRKEQRNAA